MSKSDFIDLRYPFEPVFINGQRYFHESVLKDCRVQRNDMEQQIIKLTRQVTELEKENQGYINYINNTSKHEQIN